MQSTDVRNLGCAFFPSSDTSTPSLLGLLWSSKAVLRNRRHTFLSVRRAKGSNDTLQRTIIVLSIPGNWRNERLGWTDPSFLDAPHSRLVRHHCQNRLVEKRYVRFGSRLIFSMPLRQANTYVVRNASTTQTRKRVAQPTDD